MVVANLRCSSTLSYVTHQHCDIRACDLAHTKQARQPVPPAPFDCSWETWTQTFPAHSSACRAAVLPLFHLSTVSESVITGTFPAHSDSVATDPSVGCIRECDNRDVPCHGSGCRAAMLPLFHLSTAKWQRSPSTSNLGKNIVATFASSFSSVPAGRAGSNNFS
jgi:hypothetical protein